MCGPSAAVDAAHVRSRIPRPRLTLSIQAKLLAAFGLVVALMLAVGLFAVSRLHSDNRHLSQLARVVVPSTRAVGDINALMNKYRKDQLHYIVAKPSDRPLGVDGSIAGDLADDRALMRQSLHDYRATHLVEDRADRRLLDGFGANFARYVARSRDEFGEMARDFESMIDYLRSTVGVAEAIADGDLAVEVEPRSKRDALGNSLAAMTASLRRLVSENEGLLAASREEANTDALTGLPNRRALMRDLEAGVTHASEERPLLLALFE